MDVITCPCPSTNVGLANVCKKTTGDEKITEAIQASFLKIFL